MIMDPAEAERIVSRVATMVAGRVEGEQTGLIQEFVRRYYRNMPFEDLLSRPLEDLYGTALSHWNFGFRRPRGAVRVRVLNPELEDHGWQSEHTVIEIVVDDTPFLVESVIMEVNRHNLTNHLVIHPVVGVKRTANGTLAALRDPSREKGVRSEAWIHMEVDRQSEASRLTALTQGLKRSLADVGAATRDWVDIRKQVEESADMLKAGCVSGMEQEFEESLSFLDWLVQGHFVFLGCRRYELVSERKQQGFRIVEGSGLGILRDSLQPLPEGGFIPLSAAAVDVVTQKLPLLITKATTRSTVHRPVFMDYVGVRHFNRRGRVTGETRFLGLYDSTAYSSSLEQIPLLKRKIEKVFLRSGFEPQSHSGRALMHILQDMPRDELYHSAESTLYEYAVGVIQLQERQRVKCFLRQDVYGQFVSALVFVPRDRYHTDLRKLIQSILISACDGKGSEFRIQLSESMLARIHFIIHTGSGSTIEFNIAEIEQRIVEALQDWNGHFREALHARFGEEQAVQLFNRYSQGISAAYREDFTTRIAVLDITHLEELQDASLQLRLYQPLEPVANRLRFKLYTRGEPAPLSNSLPMLENMGVRVLDERPYGVRQQDCGASFWIHDFGLEYCGTNQPDIDAHRKKFEELFEHAWAGRVDNDGFNRLVLIAQLEWPQIVLLRALFFYLRQTGIAFSQSYVEQTLAGNSSVTRMMVNLFEIRFDPSRRRRDTEQAARVAEIESAIDEVASLDEDRILRRYLNLVVAMLRTNYFQKRTDPEQIPYLAFKFDSAQLLDLPAPRPHVEIFVYSPRVEGIHLRGGPVARGGLRWSDRREDYRTEILGLMKAQVTKNSVIVPTGAKGGFVAKRPLDGQTSEQIRHEVEQCYRIFIHGLLDLTDNLVGQDPVRPEQTVCYDGNDSYLVVAADKGTASFSDIANEISGDYDFWLGDAFASGGSVGYDHKKMGITARGAWESVKHHFSALGLNVQKDEFSAVGIGDMSGDVFGNGMLLTKTLRLVAAFNHKHIFIDPDPDAAASWKERRRLFRLARSSWADYDTKLVSRGGGVFSRDSKVIKLSGAAQTALGIDRASLTPAELVQGILKAPVDLLWNGGIGTYVKASTENNAEVGDRTNDVVRVDASELRCRVTGEGGNLGFTQKGRLEFSAGGGHINTDSIDNSAGVDSSDHEVNIKILLNRAVADGDMTLKQRAKLLESMTDEVAALVLRNNFLQNRTIGSIQSRSAGQIELYQWVIRTLETTIGLDRALESIPDDQTLGDRICAAQGLLRPEISVLLAYTKIMLKQRLLSEGADFENTYSRQVLENYFPQRLRESGGDQLQCHRLRKEIIANQLVNSIVNRLGIIFPLRMLDESGIAAGEMLDLYIAAIEIFDLRSFWNQVDQLEGQVPSPLLMDMQYAVSGLVENTMQWLHGNVIEGQRGIEERIAAYQPGVQRLLECPADTVSVARGSAAADRTNALIEQGVPGPLAGLCGNLDALHCALDIIAVHLANGHKVSQVAATYFELDRRFHWDWLRERIDALPRGSYWQSLSRSAMRDDFNRAARALTLAALRSGKGRVSARIEQWFESCAGMTRQYFNLLDALRRETEVSAEYVAVLLKELRTVAATTRGE